MQKDPTQQRRGPDPRLAHPGGVGGIDLRLQQLVDQREEHLAENRRPLFVLGRGEVLGQQGALQRGEGLVPDFAARV